MTDPTVPRLDAPARRMLWGGASGAALLVAIIVVHYAYMVVYGALRPHLAAAAYPAHARASGPYVALVVGLLGGVAISYRVGLFARAETARVMAYMVGGFVALDVLLLAMAGEPPEWAVVATWAAVAASTVVGGRLAARRLAREAHPGGTGR